MSKLTVSDEFASACEELAALAAQVESVAEGKAALFEAAGTDGIRFLCWSLRSILNLPMEVTPELAGIFLELENPNNRTSNEETKEAYARDMASGDWKETAAAFQFDTFGVMQDGGHRCRAILETGKPIRSMVAFGIQPEAVHAIDAGRMRTMANFFTFLGEKDVTNLQSVLGRLVSWEHGIFVKPARVEKRTRNELVSYLYANPVVRDFSLEGRRISKSVLGLSPSAATLSLILISRCGQAEQAARFFTQLETGADLTAHSAALHLRARLALGVRRTTGAPRGALTLEEQLAYVFTAWNRRGEEVKDLRIPGSLNDQNFPQPKEYKVTPRQFRRAARAAAGGAGEPAEPVPGDDLT